MPNVNVDYTDTPVARVQTTDDAGNVVQVEITQVDVDALLAADQAALDAAQKKLDDDTALYAPIQSQSQSIKTAQAQSAPAEEITP